MATVQALLGKLTVVALTTTGTLAIGGGAHADDCRTSATCGYTADAGTYAPGSENSCTDIKCITIPGLTDGIKQSDLVAGDFVSNP